MAIVADYIDMLTDELGFGPDDPLFPATQVGFGVDRGFRAEGLSKQGWRTAAPVREIFREAFAAARVPYANPHSFRDTLVRLGQRLCRTPEEWKAWSQNLGNESETTTFVGYGQVSAHWQSEIMRALVRPRPLPSDLDIDALDQFVRSAKAMSREAKLRCQSHYCGGGNLRHSWTYLGGAACLGEVGPQSSTQSKHFPLGAVSPLLITLPLRGSGSPGNIQALPDESRRSQSRGRPLSSH